MKHRRHRILNGVVKMRYIRVALITLSAALFTAASQAGEDFGQYRNVPHDIKAWVETLTDTNGIGCCATADGLRPQDIDWDMAGSHYRVKVGGGWIGVPDGAVVKGPNRLGHAVAWLEYDWDIDTGEMTTRVRCFLPGPLS